MHTPFFSATSKVILALALIASGYVGANALRTNLQAEEELRSFEPPANFAKLESALYAERKMPRFVGDIDGIFLAPEGIPVPETYTTFEKLCGEQRGTSVPWERAGELDIELALPEKYVFQHDDINTDVVACGDTVFVARRVYTTPSGGEVIIGRTLFGSSELDVAVDRPKIVYISGREAVVVEPLTEEGFLQTGYAWFPEPFGKTFINTLNLSRSELNELVAIVAASTR
jgi:hypothetical protein